MVKHILFLFSFLALSISGANAQGCVAGFTAANNAGFAVDIVNQATGNYTHILYEYGDGQSAIEAGDHSYGYASPGVYEICQSLIDSVNFTCFDLACKVVYVGGATCSARFSWDEGGLDYNFESHSLGDFDSIAWEFGDSTFSNQPNPQHIYDSSGSYLVCLRLFENGVMCDSVCDSIQVIEGACEALFDYQAEGLSLTLENKSRGNYNQTEWSFDDGTGFTYVEDPWHTFDLPGTYSVRLRVSDTAGTCEDILRREVEINEACVSQFFYESNSQNQFSFEPVTLQDYAYLNWDFGNGDSTSAAKPVRTYSQPGEFEVCLYKYLSSDALCSYTCKTISVAPVGVNPASVDMPVIELYPNPSAGTFTLHWPEKDVLKSFEIVDLSGRILQRQVLLSGASKVTVTTELASGSYYVILHSESGRQSLPLVIHH